MSSINRTFRDSRPVKKAALAASEFTFERFDTAYMWRLGSDAARKFWTPVLGPTTAFMADVVGEATRNGPVTMTTEDLMLRLGVGKRDVIATSVQRTVVYLGAIAKFGEAGPMKLSYPNGVYPPGAELRNKKYSPGLATEFSEYLEKVRVTLIEARSAEQATVAGPVEAPHLAVPDGAVDASIG